MKRLILVGLLAVVVGSIYSFVYACDHSRKSTSATATAPHTKIIRTVVVDATTGCKSVTTSCKSMDKATVMTFDFDVPGKTAPQFIRMMERERAEAMSPSPIRTAVTLGRAFMTTIGAVVTSLLDAASQATAFLV
jgi:hypothetical protein